MFVAKCEVIETLLSGARQTRSSKTQFFWYGLASKKKLNKPLQDVPSVLILKECGAELCLLERKRNIGLARASKSYKKTTLNNICI